MNIAKIIKRLKLSKNPKLQREVILEAWQNCDEFFVGLQFSCDPTTKVKVEKIPEITYDPADIGYISPFTFKDFTKLYDQVTQIDIDTETARSLIREAASIADAEEWNVFYRRILLKKLQNDVPFDLIKTILAELTGF
jgi:hypothetical protein